MNMQTHLLGREVAKNLGISPSVWGFYRSCGIIPAGELWIGKTPFYSLEQQAQIKKVVAEVGYTPGKNGRKPGSEFHRTPLRLVVRE
ncbi:MAG: hypothetical protein KGZ39_05620 [Simkania sp.]|nr:hypothetical protein [Simkania sp.]